MNWFQAYNLIDRETFYNGQVIIEHIGFEAIIVDPLTEGLAYKAFNENVMIWVLLTLLTYLVTRKQVIYHIYITIFFFSSFLVSIVSKFIYICANIHLIVFTYYHKRQRLNFLFLS